MICIPIQDLVMGLLLTIGAAEMYVLWCVAEGRPWAMRFLERLGL